MSYETTQEVQEIGAIRLRGNVIDENWYQHIKLASGKPYSIAILILAEIFYWYTPTEVRDESTGRAIGLRKKFRADKLQRTYQSLADKFGYTKRQVKDACHFLKAMNLITLEFRTINAGDLAIGNVLFIGINPGEIERISKPDPMTLERDRDNFERSPYDVLSSEGYRQNVTGVSLERETNTYTSTKISTKTSTEEEPPISPTIAGDYDRDSTKAEMNFDSEPISVAVEIVSGDSTTFIPVQDIDRSEAKQTGEDQSSRHGKKSQKEKIRVNFERFREAWNENKLDSFMTWDTIGPDRERLILKLIKIYKTEDAAVQALIDALMCAAMPGSWFIDKKLSIENFATNNKIESLSEKWRNRPMKSAEGHGLANHHGAGYEAAYAPNKATQKMMDSYARTMALLEKRNSRVEVSSVSC